MGYSSFRRPGAPVAGWCSCTGSASAFLRKLLAAGLTPGALERQAARAAAQRRTDADLARIRQTLANQHAARENADTSGHEATVLSTIRRGGNAALRFRTRVGALHCAGGAVTWP
ncbi:FCD domain-containing protein [Nocardia sp. IFM 10818]